MNITLVHNIKAGTGEHDKDILLQALRRFGHDVQYLPVSKAAWEKIPGDTDLIVAAGGDGTVRRVAKALLKRKVDKKILPVGILPLGTANNIAGSLGIKGSIEQIVASWEKKQFRQFNIGRANVGKTGYYFLESVGVGLIADHMKKADKKRKKNQSFSEKTKHGHWKDMSDMAKKANSFYAELSFNGITHKGNFLFVEVLNIRSISSNLILAGKGDPGDGRMELVFVYEHEREKLVSYFESKINGNAPVLMHEALQVDKMLLSSPNQLLHVDDETIGTNSWKVEISLIDKSLQVL